MVGGGTSLIFQVLFLAPLISKFGSRKLGVLMHRPDPGDLDHLSALWKSGEISTVIEKVYPLAELPEAMRYFGTGEVKGKLVIST